MHKGLRRQALENGKTMSRRAKARLEGASITSSPQISPNNSRPSSRSQSRANSRAPSRVRSMVGSGSSDDDDFETELAQWTNSSNASDLTEAQFDSLFERMEDRDFFRGSSKARGPVMAMYANSIAENYLGNDKPDRLEDMLSICLKCVREGSDGSSTVAALRAIAITAITVGDDDGATFSRLKDPVQGCARDNSSTAGQTAAIRAVSAITYFGGADFQEITQMTAWLLEIIVSDGEQIDAVDNPEVVAAAIQEWTFLTTLLPVDVGRYSSALEAFGDQLQSNAPEVLSAAAEAIATLHEAAYTLRQPHEMAEVSLETIEADDKVAYQYRRAHWTHAHQYTNENDDEIASQMKELSKSPMRHVKKDYRKELHATFRDVAHTLEYPWRGPHFSTAMNDENYEFYGHRLRQCNMTIDRWWKLARFASIKRILQDGMGEHLRHNSAVKEALRDVLEAPSRFKQTGDTNVFDSGQDELGVSDQPFVVGKIAEENEGDEELNQSMRKSRLR